LKFLAICGLRNWPHDLFKIWKLGWSNLDFFKRIQNCFKKLSIY